MKIHQLSVFLENKPGRLGEPCQALADAGVTILTLSLAETNQFGILRLIVPDSEKGKAVLEQAGCVVNVTEVVATSVANRPGGLADILQVIEDAGINVEYMYAFSVRRQDRAVLVFRFDDPDAAIALLQAKGFHVVEPVQLLDQATE